MKYFRRYELDRKSDYTIILARLCLCPSVRLFPFNNFKSCGQNLMILMSHHANSPRWNRRVYRVYSLRYTCQKLRSTLMVHLTTPVMKLYMYICNSCASGVHLTLHFSHRCMIVVVLLQQGVLLGSLWGT